MRRPAMVATKTRYVRLSPRSFLELRAAIIATLASIMPNDASELVTTP